MNIKGGTKEVEDLQGYVSEALKAIIGLLMTKQRGLLMAGFRVAGAAPERDMRARSCRPLIKITEAAQSGFAFSVPNVRMVEELAFHICNWSQHRPKSV